LASVKLNRIVLGAIVVWRPKQEPVRIQVLQLNVCSTLWL